MSDTFEHAYKQLNTQQKAAVDTIDGPVLVVAGPGTGKTQLLSVRVANILKQTDADPSNILCLTFTNKAAVNMRDRLLQLAGPESRKVVVKTFHSFAAEIMNRYPDQFWSGAKLSIAPDTVQEDLIQSILAELPLDNPLSKRFAGNFTAMGDVKQALKLVKEAGLKPDELKNIIQKNLAYLDKIEPLLVEALAKPLGHKRLTEIVAAVSELPEQKVENPRYLLPLDTVLQESLALAVQEDEPTGKTTQTGKWKKYWIQNVDGKKGIHKERERNNWWLAVTEVYEKYREALHARGYYDYADMLVEVLEQLQQSPDMLADLQEQFQYILIDEFQDTNAAQLRLAHYVADHHAANNRPNIMAVGDDDQSIFAFNGAELNNMLHFQRSYPETKTIVLTDNYRSLQPILDAATDVIELAEDRLVKRDTSLTKQLSSQIDRGKASIVHEQYQTKEHQYSAVAENINKLWQDGEQDIAILARKHSSLEDIAKLCLQNDIPITYERQNNVLENDAVKQACLIASIAVKIARGDKQGVNVDISKLVRHPMWSITPKELWKLAVENYSSPDYLVSLLDSNDENLQKIGNWLSWLARTCESQPLPRSMEVILGLVEGEYLTSPIRDYFLKSATTGDRVSTLSAVSLLLQISKEFAAHADGTLEDFVRLVDLHINTGKVIPNTTWFATSQSAVQLLTVYKAKGLEFEHVFLIDGTESMWQPRVGGRKSPANLQLQSYGEKDDDYVRLLYVAISRAKKNFTATSYQYDEQGNEILASPLLAQLPHEAPASDIKHSEKVLEENLRWPRLQKQDEKAILAKILETYQLSPTGFIEFLNVAEAGPEQFKERQLLRLPHPQSVDGAFGSAIHAALQTGQRLVNNDQFDPETIKERFESELSSQHLLPRDFKQQLARGQQLLDKILENQEGLMPKGSLSEQMIQDVMLDQARIKGAIDSLHVHGDTVSIRDFKTGKPLSSFETKDKTKQIKAWRHKMQLLFYCLLTQASGKFKNKKIVAEMVYLEASPEKMHLRLNPTPQELSDFSSLIQAVWQHVQELDFPPTDNYDRSLEGINNFAADLNRRTIET